MKDSATGDGLTIVGLIVLTVWLVWLSLCQEMERDARHLTEANLRAENDRQNQRIYRLEHPESFVDEIKPLTDAEFKELQRKLRQPR